MIGRLVRVVLHVLFVSVVGISCDKTLQIVWLIPFKSQPNSIFPHNASTSIGALALGIKQIQDQQILPGYKFNVTILDSKCNSKNDIGRLVDLVCDQRVDVVFGPPCADVVRPVAELLAYKNLPYINWISIGQSIQPAKNGTETCIRLMAPLSTLGAIMATHYIRKTPWTHIVILSSSRADYILGARRIEEYLILMKEVRLKVYYPYSNVSINASDAEIQDMFHSIQREARIIIMLIPRMEIRRYMLNAKRLDMTDGEYQFLFTDTTPVVNVNEIIPDSHLLWQKNDSFDEDAKQAFENVLYFALGHNSRDTTWHNNADDAYHEIFKDHPNLPTTTGYDEYAAYLHDSVILYGKILNISLAEDSGNTTGLNLFSHLTHPDALFPGLSGDVVINLRGDRQPSFFVFDFNSTSGMFQQVAMLRFIIQKGKNGKNSFSSVSSYRSITWGNGFVTDNFSLFPSDIPKCGFLNEKCPDIEESKPTDTLAISVSVASSAVIVVIFIATVYRCWRNEKNLQSLSWKINYSDLDFNFAKNLIARSTVQRRNSLGMFHVENAKHGTAKRRRRESTTSDMSKRTLRRGSSSPDEHHSRFHRHRNSSPEAISRRDHHSFTAIAMYKDELVSVKTWPKKKLSMDRAFLLQVKNLRELQHMNVTKFIGVCTSPDKVCSVREFCAKGSVQDLIENKEIKLDIMFKMSLAVDICQGLDYLHKSSIRYHGNLRSANCVIDSRWVCKLTDFGIQTFRVSQDAEDVLGEHCFYSRLFWTAPEILRKMLRKDSYELSHNSDIYAYGIIIKELCCRTEPYSVEISLTPKEIIYKVAFPPSPEYVFRPVITNTELGTDSLHTNMCNLIQRCWSEEPEQRPNTKYILRTLNKINPYKKASVVDNVLAMMEKYTNDLEDIVAERTSQVQEEKKKTDALLYSILPRKVADELKAGRTVEAEAFDAVTIYFSDIVEFTRLCSESTPLEIVEFLNPLYTMFDDIISNYNVYKVETIGDSYMVASGLPERNGNLAVKEIAEMSLDILQSVMTFSIPHRKDQQLRIRIGLHTGPVVAGVVGLTMPRYCLFGDTVNTASRMESTGEPLKIHISPYTKAALSMFPGFIVEERGEIHVKGKGMMHTYWLNGVKYHLTPKERSPRYSRVLDRYGGPDTQIDEIPTNTAPSNDSLKINNDNSERKISIADSGIYVDQNGVNFQPGNHVESNWYINNMNKVSDNPNGVRPIHPILKHQGVRNTDIDDSAVNKQSVQALVQGQDTDNHIIHIDKILDNIIEQSESALTDDEFDKDPAEKIGEALAKVISETTRL